MKKFVDNYGVQLAILFCVLVGISYAAYTSYNEYKSEYRIVELINCDSNNIVSIDELKNSIYKIEYIENSEVKEVYVNIKTGEKYE